MKIECSILNQAMTPGQESCNHGSQNKTSSSYHSVVAEFGNSMALCTRELNACQTNFSVPTKNWSEFWLLRANVHRTRSWTLRFPPPQQHQQLSLASKGAAGSLPGRAVRSQLPHCPALRGEARPLQGAKVSLSLTYHGTRPVVPDCRGAVRVSGGGGQTTSWPSI
jgi:hypothetical protein